MTKQLVWGALISLTTTIGAATAAWGHAVQTDYFVDLLAQDLELSFQASFSTGEPMGDAAVFVYAPGEPEKAWLEGTTDADGNFRFAPDETISGDWRLEFVQGGHRDILIVPVGADGVDYTNISQGEQADFHYAEADTTAIILMSILSLGALGYTIRKRPS